MISDQEARRIACGWHGGGGSALYALCSTGAINTARDGHDAYGEAQNAIYVNFGEASNRDDLLALRSYIVANGPRGPVDGWGAMPWEEG
jgi:hypothetical protein